MYKRQNIGVNLIDVNGFGDIPIGRNSSLQVAARKSLSGFTTTPTYSNYFDRIEQDTELENNETTITNSDKNFDFYDASLRWLYRISENDQLRLNFIYIGNELKFNENAIVGGVKRSRESSLNQNNLGAGLFYIHKWSEHLTSALQIYETDYILKANNANLLASQRFLQENKVSETGIKAKTTIRLDDRFNLVAGYEFVETQVTNLDDVDVPRIRTLISEVVRTHGLFSEGTYISNSTNTEVRFGLRHNYFDKFEEHITEPRLAIYQKITPNLQLELSGELKHQITSQVINFQNDFLGVEKRRWQLTNNNNIPILKSRQAGFALHYKNKSWLLSAEGFFKKVKGITTQSQGFQDQFEFVKSNGSYEVIGSELLINKRFNKFNLWASLSTMQNQYKFAELIENTIPSLLDITYATSMGGTFQLGSINISAGFNWRTGKPTTIPVQGNEINEGSINYAASNSSRLDDYMRLDLSAIYNLSFDEFFGEIGLSVWNVLDRENVVNQFFRPTNDGLVNQFEQSALRLTPNVMARVYF